MELLPDFDQHLSAQAAQLDHIVEVLDSQPRAVFAQPDTIVQVVKVHRHQTRTFVQPDPNVQQAVSHPFRAFRAHIRHL